MHKRGEVAESTREKILKIIEELDYHPNYLASILASNKTVTFATLFPEPPSPEGYWNKPFIGINKRMDEIRQYGVSIQPYTFSQNSAKSFIKEAGKIIELKPDGVVFAPFFSKESKAFINQLKDNQIPFVFIDSEIKAAGQLSYIGQNSFQSGLLAGKLLDSFTPGDNSILVIHFAKEMDNQNHLVQREKGFYDWFNKKGRVKQNIRTIEIGDTNAEGWMENLYQIILQRNISGIFVTSSKVFYVARLIKKYQLKNISLIGHDLIKENVEYLKEGVVEFLLCQRPEEQGYNAINKLFRHVIQKREVAKENYTSIDIITKENVDYYKGFK
ncbi:MAG: substrate-binding domain-containing protein [Chlorobi bacterium]|nr:substrate-binding domain-containing protein [Chlorobiota bacterium]